MFEKYVPVRADATCIMIKHDGDKIYSDLDQVERDGAVIRLKSFWFRGFEWKRMSDLLEWGLREDVPLIISLHHGEMRELSKKPAYLDHTYDEVTDEYYRHHRRDSFLSPLLELIDCFKK